MINRRLGGWLSVGVLASLAFTHSATAQRRRAPRVIQLEELVHYGPTPLALEWVIAAPDACPGATLLRLCGGAPPADRSCPTVVAAADALGDDALDHCAADPALLVLANSFYEEFESPASLPRAYRLYRRATSVAALREIALWRSARSAYRLSHYEDALRSLAELLNGRPSSAAAHVAEELYATSLAYDDWNEDQVPDPDFGASRFGPAHLPDAPWAFDVALHALRLAVDYGPGRAVPDAVVEVRRRWPARADEHSLELDTLVARVLESERQFVQLGSHLVAATARCREHRAGCESEFANRALAHVVQRLAMCRGAPNSEAAAGWCRSGVEFARTWLAEQTTPNPTLEADVAATVTWLDTPRPRRRRRGVTRTPPPPLTTAAPTRVEAELVHAGDLDPQVFRRQVDVEAMRACAPPQGAVIDARVTVVENGSVTQLTSTARGTVADCVRSALLRTRPVSPTPEGGSVRIDAVVFFAPGARGVSRGAGARPAGGVPAVGTGVSVPPS